jgi:hypothetical protein
MMSRLSSCLVGSVLLCLSAGAAAQENVQWASFSKQPAKLALPGTSISDSDTQAMFQPGDLDADGWLDVVAVRKEQSSQLGKRPSMLLMNISGVFTDQTAQYASVSDTVHDNGFLTPRNTREVGLGDVDNDGWLDMVTANTLSDGDPKHISHPQVYRNLGQNGGGDWLGFRAENARTPQLMTFTAPPKAVAPRFGGMALADVTGDGRPDAWFADYDTTETNIVEVAGNDLNDRLLVNQGNGYFTDESATRLTTAQLSSQFGADAGMADVNADGLLDLIKVTTLNAPHAASVIYNNPNDVGNFSPMGKQDVFTSGPYAMEIGNLNNDAFLDAASIDDAADKFRLGTGYDALNRMIWGPLKTFTFVSGSDDSFGRHVYIQDLNADGWNDVITTDVHGDLLGCGRRLHIYHNATTVPGDMNPVLKEEAEFANGGTGAGWKGVVGLTALDQKGSYDVSFGDFDNDGDLDMLLATCAGTLYLQNELNPVAEVCQADMGFAGPGNMSLSLCGDDITEAGSLAQLELEGAFPSQPIFLALGLSAGPVPFKGGLLVPIPMVSLLSGFVTDGAGNFSTPVPGSAGTPLHIYMQIIFKGGSVFELSNALDVLIGV